MTLLFLSVFFYQPTQIDAMLTWRSGKMYAFSGAHYYRYDLNKNAMDPGYPKTIQGNWPGLPFNTVDAAINWHNGKAYFFSGSYYVRYDIATDRADPGYPKLIQQAWSVPWLKVDAALAANGKFYLFNHEFGTYMRYSPNGQVDPGYPQVTAQKWSGWPFPNPHAASGYGGKSYFTSGNHFTRQNPLNGATDPGFPKTLSYLPGLVANTNPQPTAPAPTNQAGNCSINGTLTFIQQGVYQQWNEAKVELHAAGPNLAYRRQALINQGYSFEQAMSQCLKEDQLWVKSVTSITKPTTMSHNKYGWNYSWFGFVGLKPNAYRVVVPGYPTLNRWVNFPSGNQKISVNLEYH